MEQKRIYIPVPWTTRQTFLGVFVSLLPYLLFSFLANAVGGNQPLPEMTPSLDVINAIGVVIVGLITYGLFCLAPGFYSYKLTEARDRSLSFGQRFRAITQVLGFRHFDWKKTWYIIILLFISILVFNVVYGIIVTQFHLPLRTNDQVLLEYGRRSPIAMYVTLGLAVLVAPVIEEIFFRSFVFMGLLHDFSVIGAIIFSSLIFAIAHGDPGSFIVLVYIGMTLAFLRWYCDSIWPAIILHLINNGASAVVLILTLQGILPSVP